MGPPAAGCADRRGCQETRRRRAVAYDVRDDRRRTKVTEALRDRSHPRFKQRSRGIMDLVPEVQEPLEDLLDAER